MDERPIRRAASVVCVRAGAGRRARGARRSSAAPTSRFLPGYVAFPGGAVDAERRGARRAMVRRSGARRARPRPCASWPRRSGIALTADGLVARRRTSRRPTWRRRRLEQLSRRCATGSRRPRSRCGSTRATSPIGGPVVDAAMTPDGGEIDAHPWWVDARVGSSPEWRARRLTSSTGRPGSPCTELAACAIGGRGARRCGSTAREPDARRGGDRCLAT